MSKRYLRKLSYNLNAAVTKNVDVAYGIAPLIRHVSLTFVMCLALKILPILSLCCVLIQWRGMLCISMS